MECVYDVSRKHGKSRLKRQREDVQRNIVRKEIAPKEQNTFVHHDLASPDFQALLEDLSPDVTSLTGTNLSNKNREPRHRLTPSSLFQSNETSILSSPTSSRSTGSTEVDCFSSVGNDTPSVTSISMNSSSLMNPKPTYSIEKPQSWTRHLSDSPVPMDRHCPKSSNQLVLQPACSGSRSCYKLAYSTLESLHHRSYLSEISMLQKDRFSTYASLDSPSSPIRMAGPVIPTLDHVLRKNKTAVSNIRQLMACSCACDPHLAMLYASLITKILNWYQVGGGIRISMFSANASASTHKQSLGSDSCVSGTPKPSGINIALLPTTIGEFDLDEEDQVGNIVK